MAYNSENEHINKHVDVDVVDAENNNHADDHADDDMNNNSRISICIPRVDNNITTDYISKIFKCVLYDNKKSEYNFIEKIDLIARTNEKKEIYKRAFIHFCNWDKINTTNSIAIWKKLLAGEIIKIMHTESSYWKCSLSRVPRPNKYDVVNTINDEHKNNNHKYDKQNKTKPNKKNKNNCGKNNNGKTIMVKEKVKSN